MSKWVCGFRNMVLITHGFFPLYLHVKYNIYRVVIFECKDAKSNTRAAFDSLDLVLLLAASTNNKLLLMTDFFLLLSISKYTYYCYCSYFYLYFYFLANNSDCRNLRGARNWSIVWLQSYKSRFTNRVNLQSSLRRPCVFLHTHLKICRKMVLNFEDCFEYGEMLGSEKTLNVFFIKNWIISFYFNNYSD